VGDKYTGIETFCLSEPRTAAEQTRRGLYANAVLFCDSGYPSRFNRDNFTWYVKFFTEAFDEFGVAPAFSLHPDSVFNMDTTEIKNSVMFPHSGKRGKHRNGIRAA
jgi:hypothetical protein